MVKLGFIVEGETEKIMLERSDFFQYLQKQGIQYVSKVIDAAGNGNLLPQNIGPLTKTLQDEGATHIFILTDLDDDECITRTKNRISPAENHTVIVSVKAIESWFLADGTAMNAFLKSDDFALDTPETIDNPYEEIRMIRINRNNRGVGGKVILANQIMKCGFSIQRAAQHPNCASARYFLQKIEAIAANN